MGGRLIRRNSSGCERLKCLRLACCIPEEVDSRHFKVESGLPRMVCVRWWLGGGGGGAEGADGVGFGVVDAEDGQQPGELQDVVEFFAEIRQMHFGALAARTDVQRYQHAET